MTLEPLVLIILLLFTLFLLAALIIWQLFELRAMGLRDKEQRLRMPVATAATAAVNPEMNTAINTNTAEFNAVPGTDIDQALQADLHPVASTGRSGRGQKRAAKNNKQSKKQSAQTLKATNQSKSKTKTTAQGISKKTSSFKTTSFGSSAQATQPVDAFAQFAQEGNDALNFDEQANSPDLGHEANLLKPPKPENDIFSTSERRDDIWLFHTAEVDPVHPAEDMTKFRQPGGITGERGGNNTGNSEVSVKKSTTKVEVNHSSEVSAPIQPENKLRDTLGEAKTNQASQANQTVGRSSRSNRTTGFGGATTEEEKVVRMTNSSSRIAAERLIVDKEIRKTQAEAHQAEAHQATNAAIANDISVDMPAPKKVTPVKPSTPFKGTVPPIPKGVQQNLKQTLDEVADNVSNATKDEWKNYKNLKNTRSLISTHPDDE